MPKSYFRFKQFTVHQDQCAMKVNTDSCILGSFARHGKPDRILDIGTGTGILGLMMAQRYADAYIDCIEVDDMAAEQARGNFSNCAWSERLQLITGDIKDHNLLLHGTYDLIISNPPYYEDHLLTSNSKKDLAKHNLQLGLEVLSKSIEHLLSENGTCYIIFPKKQFNQFKDHLLQSGIRQFDQLNIQNTPLKPVTRIIGGFSRELYQQRSKSLVIWQRRNEYTPAFKKMLKDFYLAF